MKKAKSKSLDSLASGAEKSFKGLDLLEEVLGVTYNTKVLVGQELDAMRKAHSEYREAIKSAIAATVVQETTDLEATEFIGFARDVLKRKIGPRYSASWGAAGFANNTIGVPRRLDGRLNVLKSLELFFVAHPDAQAQDIQVTETRAAELHQTLTNNIAAAGSARVLQRQKRTVRDAAVTVMRNRLLGLHKELSLLMPPDDPRWIEFGFDVPADISVTDAPKDLTVALNALGHLVASWAHTVNAARYRVYKRMAGDTEWVPVDTTTATSFDLGAFASGAHVDVRVTAINAAGESVPSTTASAVMP